MCECEMVEDYEQIKFMASGFFEKLFAAPQDTEFYTQTWIDKTMSSTQIDSLPNLVTRKEIKNVLFSPKSDSAPVLDEDYVEFYKEK